MTANRSGTIVRIIRGLFARQVAAVIAVVLAFLLRLALVPESVTLPAYITFYPAVLLAAVLGGMWEGILATALSALIVDYWLLPPIGRLSIRSTTDIIGLTIFCISGVSVSVITELYHRSREKLAAYKMEAAVQDERRKVREARELAEQSLRESQAKLVAAMASMTDSVIITDAEGRFVDFNDAFATFYRFKSKAECSRSFAEFANMFDVFMANGEPAPAEMFAIERALKGETATNAEYSLRRKDTGETWTGSLSFGPIRDKDGVITGSVVTARDITEAKRAESRLRRFYETDLFAILYWKIDGEVVDVNNRFLEMTGYSREDLNSGLLNWAEITQPEYSALDEDARRQVRETGIHLPYEKEFIRKDGTRVWGLFSAAAYEDDRNEGISFILDVTKRKRTEEELKKLNRTLKALSNSNQAILHATDEPGFLEEVCRIITRDCDHAMVWVGIAEHDENRTVRPVVYSGFDKGYLETLRVTWDESARGHGPTGIAIRTGQPSMCRDMLTDLAHTSWCEDAIKRGYASSLAIPLKERDKAWGAITIYSREPDGFSQGEVDLLTELAGDVEFGVQTLRMRAAHARAEEALRESKGLLGLFVEHAPAALAMFDNKMRYLYASRRWKADYNLGDRELHGVAHYDVFPKIPEGWKEAHRRGLAGEISCGEADRFERADGFEQWVRWEVRPWRDAEGKVGGIVIFSEEITERKKAQEALLRNKKVAFQRQQLQALAARLQQVREEERKMVARDLHDQIGQILTAIKMDMTWVVRHLPIAEAEVRDRLAGSIELINDGVRSVRKICSGLRPGILDDLGLAAAIEWQANEFASRNGIPCQVSVPSAEVRLDGDRATAIFRIFQECLTNIARHAEARSVRASLCEQDENLLLVVRDDGKGFRESEVAGSLGVLGMKERAAGCGGSLQVSSSPGRGTTITVSIPSHAEIAEREDYEYSAGR